MSTQMLTRPNRWRIAKVRRREWQGLLYIAPWMIGFAIFILYPFIWSIQLSFMDWKGIGTARFIGFQNYTQMFTGDEAFLISIRNTLVYTLVHVPGTMILAFSVALLLNERVRFMPLFRTLFYLPSVTSGVATVVLWVWILHPTGLLNRTLAVFGIAGRSHTDLALGILWHRRAKLVWLDDLGAAGADPDEFLEHRHDHGDLFGRAARGSPNAV